MSWFTCTKFGALKAVCAEPLSKSPSAISQPTANLPTVVEPASEIFSCRNANCARILSVMGIWNSVNREAVSLLPDVSVVGLEPKTSPTNGNVPPLSATKAIVPSSRGSRSSA